MKKCAILFLFVFGMNIFAAAQSGRRVSANPELVPQMESDNDFSETAPRKPVVIYRPPAKRNKNKVKKTSAANTVTSIEISEQDVIKVETKLVTIPVSVFDRNGLYIPDLRRSDFKIFEDGAEQEIAYFGASEQSFTVILLIDTSPSTAYKIEEIQEAAIAFTNQLKPQDNVMVIEFDEGVNVLTDPTNDRRKIHKAIRRADFGNGTSLYQAVHSSLKKRLNKIEGRKAVVLFTDGVDTTSYKANYDSTLREAEEADALIFPIYYNTFADNVRNNRGGARFPFPGGTLGSGGTSVSEYLLGKRYLEDLAAVTGGRVFRPDSTPGGLTAAFEGIAEELRRQYNIGYYPREEGTPGQRKTIKVRVNRPNLVIRARDNYIVSAGLDADN